MGVIDVYILCMDTNVERLQGKDDMPREMRVSQQNGLNSDHLFLRDAHTHHARVCARMCVHSDSARGILRERDKEGQTDRQTDRQTDSQSELAQPPWGVKSRVAQTRTAHSTNLVARGGQLEGVLSFLLQMAS